MLLTCSSLGRIWLWFSGFHSASCFGPHNARCIVKRRESGVVVKLSRCKYYYGVHSHYEDIDIGI